MCLLVPLERAGWVGAVTIRRHRRWFLSIRGSDFLVQLVEQLNYKINSLAKGWYTCDCKSVSNCDSTDSDSENLYLQYIELCSIIVLQNKSFRKQTELFTVRLTERMWVGGWALVKALT